MAHCVNCGQELGPSARFCASCGAAAVLPPDPNPAPLAQPLEPVPALAPIETPMPVGAYASPPTAPDASPSTVLPYGAASMADARVPDERTVVERILGGDWRPAAFVALPTVLIAAGLAALTAASQLFVRSGATLGPLLVAAPNTIAGYLHSVSQNIAMAFGSPLFFEGSTAGELGHSPLLITVVTIVSFSLLLRRSLRDTEGSPRYIGALRATLASVALLTLASLGGSDEVNTFDEVTKLSVSPGRVLGWAALILGISAVIVALRPLKLLSERVTRISYEAASATWWGGVAATTTAVALGFIASVVAGFTETDTRATAIARMLPVGLGHSVDLGVDGWQISMFGSVRSSLSGESETLSLFHRHGLSAFFFVMAAIPLISVAVGALVIGRREELDGRTLSRCCYRMSGVVVGLYLLLAIPSTAHYVAGPTSSAHLGPQVLLGALLVTGWYLVLGFLVGQLMYRNAPARAAVGLPRRRAQGSGVSPIAVGAAGLVLLIVGVVAAAVTHGGRHAKDFQSLGSVVSASTTDAVDDSASSGSSGSSSDAQDAEAQSTLQALAVAEEAYRVENNGYTDSTNDLAGYIEPSDVAVHISYADADRFCATASGIESSNYYTYESSSASVTNGDTC